MILLDTNVISEPLKPNGDPAVAAWIDAQPYRISATLIVDRFKDRHIDYPQHPHRGCVDGSGRLAEHLRSKLRQPADRTQEPYR